MATDDDTHETVSLTSAELNALADRLLSRAVSRLTEATPSQRADLAAASAIVRVLSCIADHHAVTIDTLKWQSFYDGSYAPATPRHRTVNDGPSPDYPDAEGGR